MHKPQNQVREFHKAFENLAPDKFELDPETYPFALRTKLINEEAGEFEKAAFDKDLIAMLDAMCDLLYVTYGAAVAMGIDLEPFFDEVHRSNMTKLDTNGKPIYRNDGKILKSTNYEPPNLARVLMSDEVK